MKLNGGKCRLRRMRQSRERAQSENERWSGAWVDGSYRHLKDKLLRLLRCLDPWGGGLATWHLDDMLQCGEEMSEDAVNDGWANWEEGAQLPIGEKPKGRSALSGFLTNAVFTSVLARRALISRHLS